MTIKIANDCDKMNATYIRAPINGCALGLLHKIMQYILNTTQKMH